MAHPPLSLSMLTTPHHTTPHPSSNNLSLSYSFEKRTPISLCIRRNRVAVCCACAHFRLSIEALCFSVMRIVLSFPVLSILHTKALYLRAFTPFSLSCALYLPFCLSFCHSLSITHTHTHTHTDTRTHHINTQIQRNTHTHTHTHTLWISLSTVLCVSDGEALLNYAYAIESQIAALTATDR